MEEGELLSLVRSVNAVLDMYYRGSPPRDVVIEVEGETVSYGDLVDRLLSPARERRQEADGYARSGEDVARWRESERRARQRTGRADGDDNPGWAGQAMRWHPDPRRLEKLRSHP